MKSHQLKTLALSAACLAIALTVTACNGERSNASNQTASPSPSEVAVTPPASESPSASPTGDNDLISAEGEYTGMMDGHSIEIMMNGQATPFQIDYDTADKVSDWEMGTRVKFQYTERELNVDGEQIKQLTIASIDKA